MLKRVIGENIELVTELRPHLGSIKADKGQLSQIILNLVVNSRDAMPSSGRLTIVTGNTFVHPNYAKTHSDLLPGPYVKLVVSDTGVGIPESDRELIFEPFFTTKAQGEGTGLGLGIVQKIVQKHQGLVTVDTEPGRTSFIVSLPIQHETVAFLPEVTPLPTHNDNGSSQRPASAPVAEPALGDFVR